MAEGQEHLLQSGWSVSKNRLVSWVTCETPELYIRLGNMLANVQPTTWALECTAKIH